MRPSNTLNPIQAVPTQFPQVPDHSKSVELIELNSDRQTATLCATEVTGAALLTK